MFNKVSKTVVVIVMVAILLFVGVGIAVTLNKQRDISSDPTKAANDKLVTYTFDDKATFKYDNTIWEWIGQSVGNYTQLTNKSTAAKLTILDTVPQVGKDLVALANDEVNSIKKVASEVVVDESKAMTIGVYQVQRISYRTKGSTDQNYTANMRYLVMTGSKLFKFIYVLKSANENPAVVEDLIKTLSQ
jgi:hypothetical protein